MAKPLLPVWLFPLLIAYAACQDLPSPCNRDISSCMDQYRDKENTLPSAIWFYNCVDLVQCTEEDGNLQEATLDNIQFLINSFNTTGDCLGGILRCKATFDSAPKSAATAEKYFDCVAALPCDTISSNAITKNQTLEVLSQLVQAYQSGDSCATGLQGCTNVYNWLKKDLEATKKYYDCVSKVSCSEGQDRDNRTKLLRHIQEILNTMNPPETCQQGLSRCAAEFRNRTQTENSVYKYMACVEVLACESPGDIWRKDQTLEYIIILLKGPETTAIPSWAPAKLCQPTLALLVSAFVLYFAI